MSTGSSRISVSPQHPALAGHFPGSPILPGVLLLDEVLFATAPPWRIRSAKFIRPVLPGDTVTVTRQVATDGSLRFTISGADGRAVASGVLA